MGTFTGTMPNTDRVDDGTARQAALVVCRHARDVDDARLLLDMLGLVPDQLRSAAADVEVSDVEPDAGDIDVEVLDLDELRPAAEPDAADETPPAPTAHSSPPQPCVGCGVPTVAQTKWARMSTAEKAGLALRAAHGKCWRCYGRPQQHAVPGQPPLAAEPPSVDEAPPEPAFPPDPEPELAGLLDDPVVDEPPADAGPAVDVVLDNADARLDEDAVTRALVPVALDLITAVHSRDADAVHRAFDAAAVLRADPLAAARQLAIVAAGMCAEDIAAQVALGLTLDTTDPEGADAP